MSVVAFGLGGGAVTTWGLGGAGGAGPEPEEEEFLTDTLTGVCYNLMSTGGMLQDDVFESEMWYLLSIGRKK